MEVLQGLLRSICFFFDNIAYSIIEYAYKILLYLSNMSFADIPYIQALVNRLYVLIGIFMLFKVAFSILQFIVDPNAFSEKGKGFGKLVTNVLVAVVLLVSVPTIFSAAYKLQGIIIKSNAIGKLIMGNSTGVSSTIGEAGEMARDVQFLMYGAFFSVNAGNCDSDSGNCNNEYELKACYNTPVLGTTSMATNEDCLKALNEIIGNNDDMKTHGTTLYSFFKRMDGDNVIDDRNFAAFDDLVKARENNGESGTDWVINYLPIISTLAGAYVAMLLIMFCVDIAVRIIKLCFLQMVAPISIISYIDPKESMSDSKLRKWISECLKTYVSLFIRLATIFLVMVIISVIASSVLASGGLNSAVFVNGIKPEDGDIISNMFIYVFLIIGAFMFAKKVPDMIENLFGIKMTGELHLASAGKALVGGTIGAGIGGIASGIATGSYAAINGKNRIGAFASGFAKGTIGGAFSGGRWDGKSGMSLVKNPLNVSGNLARYYGAKQGTTPRSRYASLFAEMIGGVQPADAIKNRIDAGNRYSKLAEDFKSGLVSKANKMNSGKFNSYNKQTGTWGMFDKDGNWVDEDKINIMNDDGTVNKEKEAILSGIRKDKATWERIEQYKNLKEQYDAAIQRGDIAVSNAIKEGRYIGEYMRSDGTYGNFDDLKGTRFDDVEDNISEDMYGLVNGQKIDRDDDVQRLEDTKSTLGRIVKENQNSKEFASINDSTFASVSNINTSRKAVQTATQVTENSAKYEDSKQSQEAIKNSQVYHHFKH